MDSQKPIAVLKAAAPGSQTEDSSYTSGSSTISEMSGHEVLAEVQVVDVDILSVHLEQETSTKKQQATSPLGTLRLDQCKLYGREEHIASVQDGLFRVKQKRLNQKLNATLEFVLISGPSGSGKTAVATSIQQDVEQSPSGVYLQGKFDLAVQKEPYTAFATALQDLCCQASDVLGKEAFGQFQDEIMKNLDALELHLLHGIIPSMSHIAPLSMEESTEFFDSIKSEDQQNRLHYGFLKFIRVASAAFCPLVIFLDDLQRADVSSLELIKVLISDQVHTNLMIIGTYRSNEVNANLSTMIQDLRTQSNRKSSTEQFSTEQFQLPGRGSKERFSTDKFQLPVRGSKERFPTEKFQLPGRGSKERFSTEKFLLPVEGSRRQLLLPKRSSTSTLMVSSEEILATSNFLTLTELSLGNLTVKDVRQITMDLLSLTDESIATPLAQILQRRTLGNPNFLKTLINVLHDDNLLSFNVGTMQWTWDLDEIEKSSFATDNVVDLTRGAIQRNASEEMKQLLLCVACLGNICEEKYIGLVWQKSSAGDTSESLLQQLLKQAVKQMFLEQIGTSQFRYCHDAVKEAVISLIPQDEFDALRQRIGGILFEELTEEELEAMLFLVADLLHNSDRMDSKLSQLLLRAAEKAKGVSAFSSASFYASYGIKRMQNMCQGDGHLGVKLHSIAAEAERCLGNLTQAKLLCEAIIGQNCVPNIEKMQAHKILIDMLWNEEEDFEISLNYSLDCMGETIDCHFPRGKAGQALGALRAIKYMKMEKSIPSVKEINALPQMTDTSRLFGMELMSMATYSAFFAGKPTLMLMLLTRRIQWSFQYGFHASMAPAYATMASAFMHALGDWERGRKMAKVAVQIVERAKELGVAGNSEQEVLYRLHFLVNPWTQPARSLSNQLIDGYKTCMLHGDVQCAFNVIGVYIFNHLLSGKELNDLEANVQSYKPQMAALKYDKFGFFIGLVGQAALNLMGRTEHTTMIDGIDENLNRQLWHQAQFVKRFLFAHFGEYKAGAQNSIKVGNEWLKSYPGVYFGYDAFHQAICLYGEARQIAQKQGNSCAPTLSTSQLPLYRKHAYKNHALIDSWVKKGGPNHVHHLSILDAERAALLSCTQMSHDACNLYEKAVLDSIDGGFVNHAALTEERFADYLWGVDARAEGIHHLENAIKLFSEWGALKKVEQLRERHAIWKVNDSLAKSQKDIMVRQRRQSLRSNH
mmetsp:Transcript_7687/g.15836  ORF Transcript_7687/g.15836 Transcript_7687/m.15836 type:complete len:1210 (+) Transcript_7687:225-3854(+)